MISRANRAAAQRAPRFPVEFPIRFRSVDESAWRDGWTENVSRSGVLFRCDQALKTGTWVQMCFELPAEVLGRRGAEVECSGHIVRAEPPYGAQAEVLLAATISNYRLVHHQGNAR